jgi:hypothetical protein
MSEDKTHKRRIYSCLCGGNDVAASSQGMNAWNKKAAGVFLLQPRDKNQFNLPAVCNQHVY